MEFRALASSSAGCCYVVRSHGLRPLLLDCGMRFQRILEELDFDLNLAGCLLTHAHGDHSKAVFELLQRGIDIYASFETEDALRCRKLVAPVHKIRTMLHGDSREIDGYVVRAFRAAHDEPGTLAFTIEASGRRLLYMTDSAYSEYRFEGLTHICIECNHSREILRQRTLRGDVERSRYRRTTSSHMSLERLLEFLAAHDLQHVQEIHLLHLSDENSDEEHFASSVRRLTGKPVYVAPRGRP